MRIGVRDRVFPPNLFRRSYTPKNLVMSVVPPLMEMPSSGRPDAAPLPPPSSSAARHLPPVTRLTCLAIFCDYSLRGQCVPPSKRSVILLVSAFGLVEATSAFPKTTIRSFYLPRPHGFPDLFLVGTLNSPSLALFLPPSPPKEA